MASIALSEHPISVVIPTTGRPLLLRRALHSVFSQTLPPAEIIVVVDGADPDTIVALTSIADPSLSLIEIKDRCGCAEARNIGVRNASGRWIALLDDDDEWLPDKLMNQVRAASQSNLHFPIVFSRVVVRTPAADFTMPRRAPLRSESIADYMFRRRSLIPGEVLLLPSSMLIPRALLDELPFSAGLKKWEDVDWLLRAGIKPGVGLEFIPQALTIWYCEDLRRKTRSDAIDWRYLFDWATSNRRLFTPKTYSGVMLISIAQEAAQQRYSGAAWPLLREAIRYGAPDVVQLAWFFLGYLPWCILPQLARRTFRTLLRKAGMLWSLVVKR